MYFVYILSNKKNGTLYIGVTNNITRRVWEHKNNLMEGFTKKYSTHSLVHYEQFESVEQAILREKQLKEWKRYWKIRLINTKNPTWKDLYREVC